MQVGLDGHGHPKHNIFLEIGLDPTASNVVGKYSTREPYPKAFFIIFIFRQSYWLGVQKWKHYHKS